MPFDTSMAAHPSSIATSSFTTSTEKESGFQLFQSIDDKLSSLQRQSWKANLPFQVSLSFKSDPIPVNGIHLIEYNLFNLTDSMNKNMIARFDPLKYPVTGNMASDKVVWDRLISDLMQVSKKSGNCSIISNGSHGKGQRALVCSRYRKYVQSDTTAGGDFRKHSLSRDKSNARQGDGKKQKKKTSTSKAVLEDNDVTCKTKLVLGSDQYSIFQVCGIGEGTHTGHAPLNEDEMSTKKRTIPQEALDVAKRMSQIGSRPGMIKARLQDEYGVKVSRRQVAQTTQMAKLAKDLTGADYLEKHKNTMSDTDRVFAYLESQGASYVALYHRKGDCDPQSELRRNKGGKKSTNESVKNDVLVIETREMDGATTRTEIDETGTNEKNEDVMKYASETREVVGAIDNQDVLVALAWITPKGKQLFQAFPEQLSIDGTHDVSEEEWEMVTISNQDWSGGQDVTVRVWAPNNRNWFFRWLLQTAVPKLVGKEACTRVMEVTADGDPQECSQLDAAIKVVFINAVRRRCGWHIVDRGWNRQLGKYIGGKHNSKRELIEPIVMYIKGWLYSLMKDIETTDENRV